MVRCWPHEENIFKLFFNEYDSPNIYKQGCQTANLQHFVVYLKLLIQITQRTHSYEIEDAMM